jgi:hypothetical protein
MQHPEMVARARITNTVNAGVFHIAALSEKYSFTINAGGYSKYLCCSLKIR